MVLYNIRVNLPSILFLCREFLGSSLVDIRSLTPAWARVLSVALPELVFCGRLVNDPGHRVMLVNPVLMEVLLPRGLLLDIYKVTVSSIIGRVVSEVEPAAPNDEVSRSLKY
jgi:hypothetical protein